MLRISILFLLVGFMLPATVYGSEQNQLIERQKVICMYENIDDLLDEPDDHLVMVILTDQCVQPSNAKPNMITRSLPGLTMVTSNVQNDSSETILGPNDILMLTHDQLDCFKSNYQKMIANQGDPILVNFKNTCE